MKWEQVPRSSMLRCENRKYVGQVFTGRSSFLDTKYDAAYVVIEKKTGEYVANSSAETTEKACQAAWDAMKG